MWTQFPNNGNVPTQYVVSTEPKVSEVEGDLETVKLYQFEPVASDSSESDYRGRRW